MASWKYLEDSSEHPSYWDDGYEEEYKGEEEFVKRMEYADYEWCSYSQVWEKIVSRTFHTARKDHSDNIKLGQRYMKMCVREVAPSTRKSKNLYTKHPMT